MVFLSSGKLKNMFYDDFEQYEKIDFVDFLYGHIFFYVKKYPGEELESILNPLRTSSTYVLLRLDLKFLDIWVELCKKQDI